MSAAGELWNLSEGKQYGYGARRAHPSVLKRGCPICKAKRGELCKGKNGPMLGRHYLRCKASR